jgi:dihydrofolate synthase / folylpolyglutamate synthase
VQLGVFEVGMGGTWDATNLVRGDVAVLCPIGLDHTQYLGPTVGAVAAEKAGIIKEGAVVVVREQRPEAMAPIERRAAEIGATLVLEGRDFAVETRAPAVGGQLVSVRTPRGVHEDLFVPLFGEPLARNAAAALSAFEVLLGRALGAETVRLALARTTSPGRLEVVRRRPLVVMDGAHNPDAAAALASALTEAFTWDRLHMVVAMFADKDVEWVARLLGPLADRAYATTTSSPRAAPVERVAAALADGGVPEVERHGSVREAALAALAAAGKGDLVLVTGSFYTVGDARPLFLST